MKTIPSDMLYLKYDEQEAIYADDNIALYRNQCSEALIANNMANGRFIFLACLKGNLRIEVNSEKREVSPYHVLLCPPNATIAAFTPSKEFESMTLCISRRSLRSCLTENGIWERMLAVIDCPTVLIAEESAHNMTVYAQAVFTAIQSSKKLLKQQIIMSAIRTFLLELISNIDLRQQPDSINNNQKYYIFKSFIELVNKQRIKHRNVSWYAENLHISAKHLSKMCKEATGKTAFQWLNEFIKKEIVYYLGNTDKSIKEIAVILDFPNPSFLGKYCRKHFGMSPVSFRNYLRQQARK